MDLNSALYATRGVGVISTTNITLLDLSFIPAATMSSASGVDKATSLSGDEMESVTASDDVGSVYIQFPRRRRTIPELLASRERFGLFSTPHNRGVVKNYRVDCPRLAFHGAWCVASDYIYYFGGTHTIRICPMLLARN
jgi:hypothetical protein